MTRESLVVLRVLDDDADREWWESLGLPRPEKWGIPETWHDCEPHQVWAKIELEERLR